MPNERKLANPFDIAREPEHTYTFDTESNKQSLPERLGHKLDASHEVYPVDALGEVLAPMIKDLHEVVKAPIALCGQAVLMAASLIAQGFKDIEIDGRRFPVSLFSLIIAESGERKSAIDKFAMSPINLWEQEQNEIYREQMKAFALEAKAFKVAESELKKKNKSTDPQQIAKTFKQLGSSPQSPMKPTIVTKDTTVEGMTKHLRYGLPAMGIYSDEGGTFFGGHSMESQKALKTIALLSQAWDGSPLDMMRADESTGVFKLYNRRISMNLMVQPVVAKQVFSDPLLVQQGFIPRFLICEPDSTMGNRLYHDEQLKDRTGYKRYFARLKSILDNGFNVDEQGGLELVSLSLSVRAKELFIEFHNEIELQLGKDGTFRHISGTAAKIPEQALRIAGVITVISSECKAQFIDVKEMKAGIELAKYSLNQLVRMTEKSLITKEAEDARILLNWIAQNHFEYIYSSLEANKRPNRLRPKDVFMTAVNELVEHGYLVPVEDMQLDGRIRKNTYKILHYFEPWN